MLYKNFSKLNLTVLSNSLSTALVGGTGVLALASKLRPYSSPAKLVAPLWLVGFWRKSAGASALRSRMEMYDPKARNASAESEIPRTFCVAVLEFWKP